jgi:hypothetical protein
VIKTEKYYITYDTDADDARTCTLQYFLYIFLRLSHPTYPYLEASLGADSLDSKAQRFDSRLSRRQGLDHECLKIRARELYLLVHILYLLYSTY